MRAMAPDWVKRRTWAGFWAGASGIGISDASLVGADGTVERVEGRRCREMGKWPVLKVDLFMRRWPVRELGSGVCQLMCFKGLVGKEICGLLGKGTRTFVIVLHDLEVSFSIGGEDVKMFLVRQEFCIDNLDFLLRLAEESHSVGFLL